MKLHLFSLIIIVSFFSCNKANNNLTETPLTGLHGTFENNVINVNSEIRNYRMFVPNNLDLSQENTLIFAFHGLGIDSKDLMPIYSELNTLAQNKKAIIVYPNSQEDSWGLTSEQTNKDLSFFKILLNKIKASYKINPKRINIIGMSNGAYFCHILAKNNSETISSIAAHSGMIGMEYILGIYSIRKYPVLLIHGVNDPIFSIQTARNDLKKYENEGHPSKLIEVPNMGHEWGSKVNINDSIYSFFEKYY